MLPSNVAERLRAELERVPVWYTQAMVRDEVDPDNLTLFYRSEGRQRTMGNLGNVRAMARIVSMLRADVSDETPFSVRVARDTLAKAKQRLMGTEPISCARVAEVLDELMREISRSATAYQSDIG